MYKIYADHHPSSFDVVVVVVMMGGGGGRTLRTYVSVRQPLAARLPFPIPAETMAADGDLTSLPWHPFRRTAQSLSNGYAS